MSELYEGLHALAESWLRHQSPGHTLQPTALIHEAYIRMAKSTNQPLDLDHFRALAARAMKQTLVDHARSKRRLKRGGPDLHRVTLSGLAIDSGVESSDILAIDEAITQLGELHERHARVVEMRCFADMTESEMARVLGVSERTIRSDWRFARAWLLRSLGIDRNDEQ
ncbi:MAG: sigma-70 family RNA polymerase sigma factor [Phycisphaerales bacterium]|nr:sigma-70 family RNA polymerase sigma factor [Phycisphaerales bacterium]